METGYSGWKGMRDDEEWREVAKAARHCTVPAKAASTMDLQAVLHRLQICEVVLYRSRAHADADQMLCLKPA